MKKDLEKEAIALISKDNAFSLVYVEEEVLFFSTKRGIVPLFDLVGDKTPASLSFLADRCIGKAAAFLVIQLEIKKVYASIISEPALVLLLNNGVQVSYGLLVPEIRSHSGDSMCPFEKAVVSCLDPQEAHLAIGETLKGLRLAS